MPSYLARFTNIICSSGERGIWPGRLDFLFAAISYTVGLGPIWRFPYIHHRNGGAIFLLPYTFFMVVVGLPLVFFEISLGQFSSFGPIKCWSFAPFFQGVGMAMVFLSAVVSIYYNVLCATVIYYMFASFTSELPWTQCGKEWRTEPCVEDMRRVSNRTACDLNGWTAFDNGGCYNDEYKLVAVWNASGSVTTDFRHAGSSTGDFLHRHVLRDAYSTGLDDLGPVVWHMALCSLFVWLIVALCLSKSVKSYGKVAYFTTICPLCILAILFVNGLTLDGHEEGYRFYITPDWKKLHRYETWKDAASSVFYGLSLSFGGLITLSSYSRFNSDTIRNSFALCAIHIAISGIVGTVVFFYVGALAKHHDMDINSVVSVGYELAFTAMPDAFVTTGVPTLWTIFWFLMLACFCIGSQLGHVETVLTAIFDQVPKIRRFRPLVVFTVCCIFFLLGLPLTTQGGFHMLGWLDIETSYWNLFLLPVAELIALLIYGIPRFMNDVEIMIGERTFWCIPVILGQICIGFFLFLPTLAGVLFLNVVIRLDRWAPDWPVWAIRLGRAIRWTTPVLVICGALLSIFQARKKLRKDWFAFLTPTSDWGPAIAQHRALMQRYVPWLNLNETDGNNGQVTHENVMLV